MPNKRYQQGYRFELKVKKLWEDKGHYVIRAAGSHGIVDLIAVDADHADGVIVYGIQCKASGSISKKDLEELKELAYRGITPILAYRENGQYKEKRL